MPRRSRRRFVGLALAVLLPLSLVTAPAVTAAPPPTKVEALAAAASPTVTVAGSLQSELGCAADWDPACTATDLTETAPGVSPPTFARARGLVRVQDRAQPQLGRELRRRRNEGGANIPLASRRPRDGRVRLRPDSHVTTTSPVAQQPDRVTAADRALAGNSLRADLTREQFYFVMADRFANADTANDTGRPDRRPAATTGTTPPPRASTTAATSRASPASSTTSRSSASPRSG